MFLKNARRKLIIGLRHLCSKKSSTSDHYETLQVSRSATQAEIKNAYFELTKQYHPDKVKATDENVAKFRNITEAYEVLGNVEARRVYDRGENTGTEEAVEEADDPYKRFYESKQRHSMGTTFDTWAKNHQQAKRKERAEMKEEHEAFTQSLKESVDAQRIMSTSYVSVFLLCIFIVFAYLEFKSVPSSKSNVIERTLKNLQNGDKDKR